MAADPEGVDFVKLLRFIRRLKTPEPHFALCFEGEEVVLLPYERAALWTVLPEDARKWAAVYGLVEIELDDSGEANFLFPVKE